MLRNHETQRPFMGPALPRAGRRARAAPDRPGRPPRYLKDSGGIGYCNITKCCTEVCPEHIKITDNAIIPLKERVADEYYDPLRWAWRSSAASGIGAAPSGSSCRCCRVSPRLPDRAPDDSSLIRRPEDGRGVHRPHRRRGTRQPRSGVRGCGAVRRRPARRARSARGAGCVDLRLPRRPDQQRRRVHGRRPGARAGARARCPRGPPAPRLEADRRAAGRSLAGQGREAHPLWAAARRRSTASRGGRRPTCRAPRTRRRRPRQRGHRPCHAGRWCRHRSSAGRPG